MTVIGLMQPAGLHHMKLHGVTDLTIMSNFCFTFEACLCCEVAIPGCIDGLACSWLHGHFSELFLNCFRNFDLVFSDRLSFGSSFFLSSFESNRFSTQDEFVINVLESTASHTHATAAHVTAHSTHHTSAKSWHNWHNQVTDFIGTDDQFIFSSFGCCDFQDFIVNHIG